jgi:hypothetical protein
MVLMETFKSSAAFSSVTVDRPVKPLVNWAKLRPILR